MVAIFPGVCSPKPGILPGEPSSGSELCENTAYTSPGICFGIIATTKLCGQTLGLDQAGRTFKARAGPQDSTWYPTQPLNGDHPSQGSWEGRTRRKPAQSFLSPPTGGSRDPLHTTTQPRALSPLDEKWTTSRSSRSWAPCPGKRDQWKQALHKAPSVTDHCPWGRVQTSLLGGCHGLNKYPVLKCTDWFVLYLFNSHWVGTMGQVGLVPSAHISSLSPASFSLLPLTTSSQSLAMLWPAWVFSTTFPHSFGPFHLPFSHPW